MRYVDYLSSVSGGGYIASCLVACWSRRPPAYMKGQESKERYPFLDPRVVAHLRAHGSYLVPHGGFLGRDFLRAVGALSTSVLWSLLFFGGCLLFIASALHAFLNLLGTHALIDDISRQGLAIKELSSARFAQCLWETPKHLWVGSISATLTLGAVWITNSYQRRRLAGGRVGDRLESETFLLRIYGTGFYGLLLCFVVLRRALSSSSEMEESLHALLLPLRYAIGWGATALLAFFASSLLSSSSTLSGLIGGPLRRTFAVRSLRESLVGMSGVLVGSAGLLIVVVVLWSTVPSVKLFATAGGGLLCSRAWIALARVNWEKLPSPIRSIVTVAAPGVLLVATILTGLVAALAVSDRLLHFQGVARAAAYCAMGTGDRDVVAIVACALVGGGVALLGFVVNLNILSPHHFYRDRLADTFLTAPWPSTESPPNADPRDVKLKDLLSEVGQAGSAPYPIINCALNLPGSTDLTLRNRKSALFVFSPYFCGSSVTGYVKTDKFRRGSTTLATAMAVSGAAANSGMGYLTSPVLAFFVTLFNLRLGYWMRNPLLHSAADWTGTSRSGSQPVLASSAGGVADEGFVFWPKWVMQEAFALIRGNAGLINVSDGGHTGDNLGIYSLLQRRVRVIVAIDAGCDPAHGFQDLLTALHQIEVDEGVVVDIKLEDLALDKVSGRVERQFAVGRILYPERLLKDSHDADPHLLPPDRRAEGWLVYIKSSLRGDEPEGSAYYKVDHPEFPHQSTGDQFFNDRQFDAYRALGSHLVCGLVDSAKKCLRESWVGSDASADNLLRFAAKHFRESRLSDQPTEKLDLSVLPQRHEDAATTAGEAPDSGQRGAE